MKKAITSLYMAFGMFCAIPMPKFWDESCAKHVMPWLPVVGSAIGAIWYFAAELFGLLQPWAPDMLLAGALMLVPFFASGFIHLDGYMDTSDAIMSRRPQEEKLRILKDPHTGAFAVIMVAVLFVMQFAAVYAVFTGRGGVALLLVIPIMSRCCSAMSVLCLKPIRREGYAYMFRPANAAPHRAFAIAAAVSALALAWLLAGAPGLIVLGAVVFGYAAAMARAYASFGGISGDLAGYSLVIGELCGLIVLAIV